LRRRQWFPLPYNSLLCATDAFVPLARLYPNAGCSAAVHAWVSTVFWVPAFKKFQTNRANELSRLTVPLQYARHPLARNHLASFSAVITAGSVVASSAGSILLSKFVSMSLLASIPKATCTVHAIAAMARFVSGNIFARAAATARAPTIARRLLRSKRLLLRSVQRTLA
jgi:hypothetical protein